MYRLWTKNAFGSHSVMTDWTTRAKARQFAVSRWGHVPCWAYISKAKTLDTFVRANGE